MDRKGIALIMVLWALTILMVIVLSFSFMTRTESASALSFKEGMENKFLAEAGMERAITEIFYRRQNLNIEGSEVWRADNTPYTVQAVNGFYTVRLLDESGKVDINNAPDVILKNLLINLGASEEADTITDSIMDWKDPDDLHRLHGAESDYYMSLPNPYKAKDANFEAVEELLLVKGVTPEILYGSKDRKGLADYLTVNSKTRLINVNSASKEVLMSIPGMTPEAADSIISYREGREIRNIMEIQESLGANYAVISQYVTAGGAGSTYTIDATGSKTGSKAGYSIRATIAITAAITITGSTLYKYLFYKSPVHLKQ